MEKKSNTQLLKDIQNIADDIEKKKQEVEILLQVIDNLELQFNNIIDEIKNNSKKV